MKKAVFLIEDLKFGGVENSLVNLLNNAKFNEHGYKAVLIMWGKQYDVLENLKSESGVKVKIVASSFLRRLCNLMQKIFGGQKAEKIYNIIIRALVLLAVKRERADVVIRYHHAAMKTIFNRLNDKSKKIMWYHISECGYYLDREYTDACDKIVVVSEQCREIIAKERPYLASKLAVVSNIIDEDGIREKAKCSDELFDSDFNIVSCARISPEKGVLLAVKACKIILDSDIGGNFKWYFIGPKSDDDTDYYNEVVRSISEYGLNEKFILLGAQSNPYKYFSRCDLFVQPSLNEAQPLVLKEAFLCGAPIVSTATVGGRSTVEDGVNGLIADISPESVAEKICGLIKDSEKLNKLKKNAEMYDVSEQNRQIVKAFYQLLQ